MHALPGRSATLGEGRLMTFGALRLEIGWRRRSPWNLTGPGATGYVRLATTAQSKPRGEVSMAPRDLRELAGLIAGYADELDAWQTAEAIEDQQRAEFAS